MATDEVAVGGRCWRLADGVGRATWFWLQHRRICRRGCVRVCSRLGLVSGGVAGLPDRYPFAPPVWPVAGIELCAQSTSPLYALASQLYWLTTFRALRPGAPCRRKISQALARPAAHLAPPKSRPSNRFS